MSRRAILHPSRDRQRVRISHKEPGEHHDDAHHDAAPREPDGDPAENPVRLPLAAQKATAEPAEEAGCLSPARYPPAIVGEPRLKACFVVVFVCRKTVERAEQAIESAGELWVDAPFLRHRRPSSWLRECHRRSCPGPYYSGSLLVMDATSVSSSIRSSVGSDADFSPPT